MTALLSPLGYLGYRVAAHNQWIIVTRNARSFDRGTEPKVFPAQSQLSMLVVGDTGKDTQRRAEVVQAMRRHARWSRPDAAIILGDNFYERGVESVDDPRFDSDFESLFDRKSFDIPFYACLGNHDVGGDADAQVQYTKRSQRWKMPSRYFKTSHRAGGATVDIFVLDTNTLDLDDDATDQQLKWLRAELAASQADYKIVAGHHPAISGGQHEVTPSVAKHLSPIFSEFNVDVYLSGHDHDLQLLDSGEGWLQVVSGAGSKLRSTSWIDETRFAEATAGFCWLVANESELSLSFYSSTQRLCTYVVPAKVPGPMLAIANP